MISLLLGGSFYPLHVGHIEILFCAKDHYESNGYKIIDLLICPSHFTSLNIKFPKLNRSDDNRIEYITEFIKAYPSIKTDFTIISSSKNIGFSRHVTNLIDKYKKDNINLIQVCGTDVSLDHAKHKSNIIIVDNERDFSNRENMESMIIIKNSITVPKTSSTIERFICKKIYHETTISPFDLCWITATDITLGYGNQGIVKLVYLGKKEVALKLQLMDPKNTPEHFIYSCKLMEKINNVYAYGIDDMIGWILYDVGIPLNDIISVFHGYMHNKIKNRIHKIEIEAEKFIHKNIKKTIFTDYEKTEAYKIKNEICENYVCDPTNFKKKIIDQLFDVMSKLKCGNIIHRDIHYDNIILTSRDVMLIDFGCAKSTESQISLLRGSIRYYPYKAIIDKNYYDFNCDLYMCSLVMYEIIEEHEIYPDCMMNIEKVVEMKKNKIHPVWNNKSSELSEIICNINMLWNDRLS